MTDADHKCAMPHADGRAGDAFTCSICGSEYELVYTGLWGLPLRFKRLFQALGRKLKGLRR